MRLPGRTLVSNPPVVQGPILADCHEQAPKSSPSCTPFNYPLVRCAASGTKTRKVKKPQAERLDRCEVTEDQSGLGSGFSSTSSKLWQCQGEKNEGSEEKCLPASLSQPKSLLSYPRPFCSPNALRSGSIKEEWLHLLSVYGRSPAMGLCALGFLILTKALNCREGSETKCLAKGHTVRKYLTPRI